MAVLLVVGEVSSRQYRDIRFRIYHEINEFPKIHRCSVKAWQQTYFHCESALRDNTSGALEAFLSGSESFVEENPGLYALISDEMRETLGLFPFELAGVIINWSSDYTQVGRKTKKDLPAGELEEQEEEEEDLLDSKDFIRLCEDILHDRNIFNQELYQQT
jgi:hypothetical protein